MSAQESHPRTPTIESIHRDIALSNTYRLELIKWLLAIAAAVFAFTVTFRPSLVRVDLPWAMWLGWLGLAISMIGGMFHMIGWDHYYKSYRDYDWKYRDIERGRLEGKAARKKINRWRKLAMALQFSGFIAGVLLIGLFAAANIDNARKPDESAVTTRPQSAAQPARPQKPPAPK